MKTKPKKPSPTFPLTPHPNGQWCKKIRGKVRFFGAWADSQAALDRYLAVAADLHAGREPIAKHGGLTLENLADHYLTYQVKRMDGGQLSINYVGDCRTIIRHFVGHVGEQRRVAELQPTVFQDYRNSLATRGMARRPWGPHALRRAVVVIRGMFSYALEGGLIKEPVRFGKAFSRPTPVELQRSKRRAASNGKRLFAPDEIRAILAAADGYVRVAVFLGINVALGNTDCSRLPLDAIDCDEAVIHFDRPKTGIQRVAPLWPETVEAIQQWNDGRPEPADEESARLLLLDDAGRQLVWQRQQRAKGTLQRMTHVDNLTHAFNRLLERLNLRRPGRGFYALRHTFRTLADDSRDQHAICRIMGHALPGMAGPYVEEISVERLRAVTEHVRAKVLPRVRAERRCGARSIIHTFVRAALL